MSSDFLPGMAEEGEAEERNGVPAPASGRGGARPGAGRPVGAPNRTNRDLRRMLVGLTGREAIVEQYKLASEPIMSDEVALERLAWRFACTRKEAVEIWLKAAALVYPHVYPKLGQLELRPPGAPEEGGGLGLFDIDGEGVEISDLPLLDETEAA